MAGAIAEHYGVGLLGLVVHADEAAPHAHFWLDARTEAGDSLARVLDGRTVQDLAAAAIREHFPGIARGRRKRDRVAAGEPASAVINRSVRQLHQDLPGEIAAAEAALATAAGRAREMADRVARLEARRTELGELAVREARRLETYTARLHTRRAEVEAAEHELARLTAARAEGERIRDAARIEAEQAERRRAEIEAGIATAQSEAAEAEATVRAVEQRCERAEARAAQAERRRATAEAGVVAAQAKAARVRTAAETEAAAIRADARTEATALAEATVSAVEVITTAAMVPRPEPGQWRRGPGYEDPALKPVVRRAFRPLARVTTWPARAWQALRDLADRVIGTVRILDRETEHVRERAERVRGWEAEWGAALDVGPDPDAIEATLAELRHADPRPEPSPFDNGP